MTYLRQILAEPETAADPKKIRLDRAALELATIHFPDLDLTPSLDRLNELASQVGDRLRNFNDGRDFVETAQRYLFEELGFHGNKEDYYDPLNSCLNQVLERRTGIPVTLSVMYMEIARRLQMPVYGIGLPRHFVIQFDDGNYATYIDPFHGGRAITLRECFQLAGAREADITLLRRVSPVEIIKRMLQNLQSGYLQRHDSAHAAKTIDLLILGTPPGSPELANAHKLRGLLLLELKRYHDARKDLEQYLSMKPEAADREEILKQISGIHRWLGRVN